MAKGRKLTTSQSELFLGSYGYGNGYVNARNESSDLGEEDIWSMVDELASSGDRENDDEEEERIASNSSRSEWNPRATMESSNNNIPIMRRRGGGEERHLGGLLLAFEVSDKTASSQRILHQFHYDREGCVGQSPRGGGTHHMATSAPVNVPDWSKIYRVDSVESLQDSDGGLEEQLEMVPPHEYLARSRRTGTTSVFEGVGRTLKGRDLRRVRDAVWSQTGFDG